MKELLRTLLPFLSLGRVVYRVPWSKEIFLTFDDGPNPDVTPAILAILKKYSVPATFFLLGRHAATYPELVAKIADEGHSVANHTFSHVILSTCTLGMFYQEIQQCRKVVPGGNILRPPAGAIKLSSMLLAIVLRYKLVFWSVDALDYKKSRPFEQVIDNVIQAQPRQGDIILFHDINKNTVKALPVIIEELRQRGLNRFGTF